MAEVRKIVLALNEGESARLEIEPLHWGRGEPIKDMRPIFPGYPWAWWFEAFWLATDDSPSQPFIGGALGEWTPITVEMVDDEGVVWDWWGEGYLAAWGKGYWGVKGEHLGKVINVISCVQRDLRGEAHGFTEERIVPYRYWGWQELESQLQRLERGHRKWQLEQRKRGVD